MSRRPKPDFILPDLVNPPYIDDIDPMAADKIWRAVLHDRLQFPLLPIFIILCYNLNIMSRRLKIQDVLIWDLFLNPTSTVNKTSLLDPFQNTIHTWF